MERHRGSSESGAGGGGWGETRVAKILSFSARSLYPAMFDPISGPAFSLSPFQYHPLPRPSSPRPLSLHRSFSRSPFIGPTMLYCSTPELGVLYGSKPYLYRPLSDIYTRIVGPSKRPVVTAAGGQSAARNAPDASDIPKISRHREFSRSIEVLQESPLTHNFTTSPLPLADPSGHRSRAIIHLGMNLRNAAQTADSPG